MWQLLKNVTAWSPLSPLPGDKVKLTHKLYRLAPETYVLAMDHDKNLRDVPGESFVTMTMWAVDDGAAKRAANLDIESDGGNVRQPPDELLLDGAATYATILANAQTGRFGVLTTYGDYRIASDGRFVHQVIKVGDLQYLFRNPEAAEDELPYAIKVKLPGTGPRDFRLK